MIPITGTNKYGCSHNRHLINASQPWSIRPTPVARKGKTGKGKKTCLPEGEVSHLCLAFVEPFQVDLDVDPLWLDKLDASLFDNEDSGYR